jgi:uncharacterized protein HemX
MRAGEQGVPASEPPPSAEMPRPLPPAPVAPSAPPKAAQRTVSDRVHKAPQLPPRKSKRSGLETVLVVLAVLVIVLCLGFGGYVIFKVGS